MCFRGMQRDTLTLTLSTAEFSYYTRNILEGISVWVVREKVEFGLSSSDGDLYFRYFQQTHNTMFHPLPEDGNRSRSRNLRIKHERQLVPKELELWCSLGAPWTGLP